MQRLARECPSSLESGEEGDCRLDGFEAEFVVDCLAGEEEAAVRV